MGNMVLVAIRHSDLDATRNIDFDVLETMINDLETSHPKFFDGGQYSRHHSMAYDGTVIMSHYYHSRDDVNLVVSNEMMSYFPSFISFYEEAKEYDHSKDVKFHEYALKKAISSAKNNESFYSRKRITTKKSRSKDWNNLSRGDSYSLFGILTDQLHDINKDTVLHEMVNAIDEMNWVENGHVLMGTSMDDLDNNPVIPLGNYRHDQIAMASLSRNVFSVLCVENHGIDHDQMLDRMDKSKNKGDRFIKISSFEDIVRGFKRVVEYRD